MVLILKYLIYHFLLEMFLIPFLIVYIFCSLFDLREYVLMLVTPKIETIFLLLSYKNKVINIMKFVRHFLNSTTNTQSCLFNTILI